MNRKLLLFCLFGVAACNNAARSEINYHCSENIVDTVKYSSAVIYGVEVPPPIVEGAYPISEDTLVAIGKKTSKGLQLIAMNTAGGVFSRSCNRLCDVDDASHLVSTCRNTPGCKIVGGVKDHVFYPFYTSDRNGGHICKRGTDEE